MIDSRQLKLVSVGVICASILGACGDTDSTVSNVSTAQFDSTVVLPAEAKALSSGTSGPLLYAIQTQGFETEYDSGFDAPHEAAWERWNLDGYVDDGAYTDVLSCADIAKRQRVGSGKGTVTIVNSLQENYVGRVEHRYDGCVIGDRAYSGVRRIVISEEPRDHPSGRTAASFQWEYENYYWGIDGLDYFLDGVISFNEISEAEGFNYPFRSTGNYTFSSRDSFSYSMRELVSQCDETSNELSDSDYSHRCIIQSGHVALHGLGEFSVKTLQPVHQSVWLWGAKLQISDNNGNQLIFWGEDGQKRMTLVNAEGQEETYAVEYGSSDIASMKNAEEPPVNFTIDALDTRFKRWEKELYASETDEFIFFNRSDAQFVDSIRYVEEGVSQERRIDLMEPAYTVNVIFEGDSIASGHDGATRIIYLNDPELSAHHREIGLGKIVEIYDGRVVAYQVPGINDLKRVSFEWDNLNQVITSQQNLGYGDDIFAYKNGDFVIGDSNSLHFEFAQSNGYDYTNLRLGQNHGYVKYFDNDLVVNGNGSLIRCTSRCSDSAVYWKSVNEAIMARYPAADVQTVVAAVTDTEGSYTPPNVMILATKAKSDWVSIGDQRYPKTADHLWAIDLNDTQRVVKLDLPFNEFSKPEVKLQVRELFNRKGDNFVVGIGSWDLHSGRENTVMFELDLDLINFD